MMHFLNTLRLSFLILCLSSFHASAITEFVPEDGAANDQFGYAVGLKGNIALVGAPGDDDNFRNEGTLYVLEKLNGAWVVKEKIYASDASAENRFGHQIVFSRSRNSAIIDGKYLFTDDGNGNWSEESIVSIPNFSVSNYQKNIFLDDMIIIGSGDYVKIYQKNGFSWDLAHTLQSDDFEVGDDFGSSLDFDGEYLIISAESDYYRGSAGSLYVFQLINGNWQQTIKTWGDNRYGGRRLGNEIKIFENFVYMSDSAGRNYLFNHPRNVWDYFEAPLKIQEQWYINRYPGLTGPFTVQCEDYSDCGNDVLNDSYYGREISFINYRLSTNETLAMGINTPEYSNNICLEFADVKTGSIRFTGIYTDSLNSYSGKCSSHDSLNASGRVYDLDGTNLMYGKYSENIWGQNSGAVFFEDISASLPQTEAPDGESVMAGDLAGSVKQGGNISGTLSATDPDGLTDGTYFVITSQPSNGTAFIDQASGAWFYVANAQYEGADPFTVTVTDDQGNTTQQVVSITVTGLTVTGDINVIFDTNTTFNGDIDAQDADGLDSLIYSLVVDPINGTATVDPLSGNWTYEPNTDYVGSDSFTIGIAGVGFGQQLINLTIEHPDTDNDSIKDNIDNCINESNADQLDTDGDLQGDACDNDDDADSIDDVSDNCPLLANISQEDLDQDGTGDSCDSDRDGDGSQNDTDNCPDNTNAGQEDLDGDAFGDACDPDIDGDGLLNFIETKFSGDPNDPSDFTQISQLIDEIDLTGGEEVTIPMVGGLGLLALFVSMLGFGVVGLSRRY